jgi:hypothetical protein
LIWRRAGWSGGEFGPFLPESRELYDLSGDPEEAQNLIQESPIVLEQLEEQLESHVISHERVGTLERRLTPEERARLRSLGYVE